jgi:hypothetical protein
MDGCRFCARAPRVRIYKRPPLEHQGADRIQHGYETEEFECCDERLDTCFGEGGDWKLPPASPQPYFEAYFTIGVCEL